MRKLLLCSVILLAIGGSLQAAPAITVSASAVTLLGTGQQISITVQLIDPNNTGMLKVSGTGIVPIMRASTVTPGTTATVGPIYGNDVILDGFGNLNNTYYIVQVFTVSGGFVSSTPALQNFYAFTGSGTVDLATATPLAPSFMSGPSGNVVMPGNLTVSGTGKFTGTLTSSSGGACPPSFFCMDGTNYPYTDAGLRQLFTDCQASSLCSGVDFSKMGTDGGGSVTLTATVTLSKQGLKVYCGDTVVNSAQNPMFDVTGRSVELFGNGIWPSCDLNTTSGTADVIKIESTSLGFHLHNVRLRASVARTGGACLHIQGAQGIYENFRIEPCFNGMVFDATTAQNNQVLKFNIGGSNPPANWNAGIFAGVATSGLTSSAFFNVGVISGETAYADAAVVYEGGVDGYNMENVQIANSTNGMKCLHLRNTNGNPRDPEWVSFTDLNCQTGATSSIGSFDGVTIAAVRDGRFNSPWVSGSQRNFVITGGQGIRIGGNNCFVAGSVQENILVSGGDDIGIHGCRFGDGNYLGTTQTFANLHFTSGPTNWRVDSSFFKTIVLPAPGPQPKNDMLIDVGANTYTITHNGFQSTGTVSSFVDNAAGATRTIFGNQPDSITNYQSSVGWVNLRLSGSGSGTTILNASSTASGTQTLPAATGTVADNTQAVTLRQTLHLSDQGAVCTNGELALSAGWQSTGSATVTAVAGNGQTCSWTITTGTTTAANPTVTDTLTNALPAATTVCWMNIYGGSHTAVAGESLRQTTLSATAPIFTANFTPTAGGTTYFVTRSCGP